MRTTIHTDQAPQPIGPYEQAILIKDTLYISGQIGLDPETGALQNGDVQKETEQVMRNLKAILEKAVLKMDDLVRCTIYVTDMGDFGTVNEVYGGFFENHTPSRSCVEVANLPKGARVKISGIAVSGE